ncbi:MAG TPA: bifunctional shikimate kinase/3-dehydroquinate synthase [Gaiellaceae bacterium]|nr:bifunctional shikimate kinase/3-dehydroquinate synthase [Gaiellaceae bacterium]
MGAGKSTLGRAVADRTQRPFVDTDAEIERLHGPIPELFERGEAEFRRLEEQVVAEALAGPPAVIALGGGAILSERTRERLRAHAFVVHVEVDADTAWQRVGDSGRPLARDEEAFRRLHQERAEVYKAVSQAAAGDVDGILLAALRISFGMDGGPSGVAAVVADEHVLTLHRPPLEGPVHAVPAGELAKTLAVVERLWSELSVDRDGTIAAFGGGSTIDVAGFAAATHLRGVEWVAMPTTLTGQVDAAIGGKTGIDTQLGKNLAGAFHFPSHVLVDNSYLATLPESQRRAGMAEVVKTGLLAGRDLWALPEQEMVRACAAYKAGVVLSDPWEREGRRAVLNLGHTFAHALEKGSGYTVSHGEAVALGLLAALRLSGLPTDPVEELLRPQPITAAADAAWAALKRDKKGEGLFVLLEAPGRPVVTTVSDEDARRALDALIRK